MPVLIISHRFCCLPKRVYRNSYTVFILAN